MLALPFLKIASYFATTQNAMATDDIRYRNSGQRHRKYDKKSHYLTSPRSTYPCIIRAAGLRTFESSPTRGGAHWRGRQSSDIILHTRKIKIYFRALRLHQGQILISLSLVQSSTQISVPERREWESSKNY